MKMMWGGPKNVLSSLQKVFSGLEVRRCGADARFDESINSSSSLPATPPCFDKTQNLRVVSDSSFCLFGDESSEQFVVVATET